MILSVALLAVTAVGHFAQANPDYRVSMDIPFRADLRRARGVAFDFRISDAKQCSQFSFYDNIRHEIDTFVEIARKHPDGIHFDYVRYPDSRSCFCDGCRRRFEAKLGKSVDGWPKLALGPTATRVAE